MMSRFNRVMKGESQTSTICRTKSSPNPVPSPPQRGGGKRIGHGLLNHAPPSDPLPDAVQAHTSPSHRTIRRAVLLGTQWRCENTQARRLHAQTSGRPSKHAAVAVAATWWPYSPDEPPSRQGTGGRRRYQPGMRKLARKYLPQPQLIRDRQTAARPVVGRRHRPPMVRGDPCLVIPLRLVRRTPRDLPTKQVQQPRA